MLTNFTNKAVYHCQACIFQSKELADPDFSIPKKLNRILEELELQERSILWLSKKTGLSYQTVYDYCHNIRQPNLVKLKRIAIVLKVQAAELVIG